MAGVHTGQQNRSQQSVPQQMKVGPDTDSQRKDESKQSQHRRLDPDALEVFHIHLQTGQKHDIIESYFSEKLKAAVAHQNIETMLSDCHSGQNHSDDMRNTQTFQNDGGKQNDNQYQEENPRRIRYGQRQVETYLVKHFFHKSGHSILISRTKI